jgi:ribosomal protein S18 acetylase RimI-like enzyme
MTYLCGMHLTVKPAGKEDISIISRLADKIWHQYYPSIISLEQIAYMLERFYSEKALNQEIQEGHLFYLVFLDDQPMGYLCESESSPGDFFLHKFYLCAEVQNCGIGRKVFEEIFFSKPSIKSIHLTVNRQNYKAINFYFRIGFQIEKMADFDIGNGYFMNDFVMCRNF